MEKVGIFYFNRRYFLYPEKYGDIESLRKYLEDPATLTLTELLTAECMPPYFNSSATVRREVYIGNAGDVIPFEGYILDSAEYDERLREQVIKNCPGCPRYGGDAEDLTGHYEEMTLDGKCFMRCTKEEFDGLYFFKSGCLAFWEEFADIENELYNLVKSGNTEKADERITAIAGKYLSSSDFTQFCTGKAFGKAVLMMSAPLAADFGFMNKVLAECAPKSVKKHWIVLDYLCCRYYKYRPVKYDDGSRTADDLSKTGVTVEFEKIPADRPRFNVTLYAPASDCPETIAKQNAYNYLVSIVGENCLCAANASFEIVLTDDYKPHKDPVKLKKAIKSAYLSPLYAPYLRNHSTSDIILVPVPGEGRLSGQMTVSVNSIPIVLEMTGRADITEALDFAGSLMLKAGYIVFDLPKNEDRKRTMDKMAAILAPSVENGSVMLIGGGIGEVTDVGVFFFVMSDEKMMKRDLYIADPELKKLNAELIIK